MGPGLDDPRQGEAVSEEMTFRLAYATLRKHGPDAMLAAEPATEPDDEQHGISTLSKGSEADAQRRAIERDSVPSDQSPVAGSKVLSLPAVPSASCCTLQVVVRLSHCSQWPLCAIIWLRDAPRAASSRQGRRAIGGSKDEACHSSRCAHNAHWSTRSCNELG